MDTPKPQQNSAHLLDDLESIRQLLGDDNLQPPLLTDTVEEAGDQEQIPMLFDTVGEPSPTVEPPPVKPAAEPAPSASKSADALLHLDGELRDAALLIMQDVIDDFAPHIETEIKRRLSARMERLLTAATSGKL